MTEFDDYDEQFDPDGEFDGGFEDEPWDEEPEDWEGDDENGEENEEKDTGGTFQGRNVETDPWKEVLGECHYCGSRVTRGWLESWGGVGENGWEAFGACPNCQAGVFFQNGGHF
jgi:hypothetical protein